jgi:hypothetical protein
VSQFLTVNEAAKLTGKSLKVGERFVKQDHQVWKEYVELLEDPWGFPELTHKKALQALEEIRRRPEYQTPTTAVAHRRERQSRPPADPDNPNLGI